MRVIQANKAYYPHLGGIETVVQQLAEGFITRHGWESAVVTCSDDRHTHRRVHNGVRITSAATLARLASLPISPAFATQLLRQRGAILQIHEPFLLGGLAYLARRRRARRRFRHLVVWWHSDIVRQRTLRPFYTPLLRRVLRAASAVIVATPHHITSSAFLPAIADKCHVIPYGVDLLRFAPTPAMLARAAEFRRQYGPRLVLFSGRLVYYKGAQYLVRAMSRVPDAHLVVVGKGPLLPELQALAGAAGTANVSFVPYLAEPDFVAMYQASDLFVLPSVENSEAFGIVQIEAMACGKPVITANLPTGVTYVNRHDETGLVVPPRDVEALATAIRTLLDDDDLRQRLGRAAQARVAREFTIKHMVDQTAALYCRLLGYPTPPNGR
jgi:rhamnosyl/mannosyltransferase